MGTATSKSKARKKSTNSAPLVVHIHLFKNAGTSIDLALEKHFGRKWVNLDSGQPAGRVTGRDMAELLKKKPKLQAISSHQVRPPVDKAVGRPIRYVAAIRHPIARVKSIYDFDRKRGPVTPMGKVADKLDFPDYVAYLLAENNQNICNFQVRSFSTLRSAKTTKLDTIPLVRHLDAARAFAAQDNVSIGHVDDFDRTSKDIERLIKDAHPKFSFVVAHVNRTSSPSVSLDERLCRLRDELGDKLYTQLEQRNWADLELLAALEDKRG